MRPNHLRTPRSRALAAALCGTLAAVLLAALGHAGASAAPRPQHVENPFAGSTAYVNPDYADLVQSSIDRTRDRTLRARMKTVQGYPTAVWMDRIAAIGGGEANDGRRSLAGHLDLALAQQRRGKPVTVTVVIYNLPGRDCAAHASNGELPLTERGLKRYQKQYIDPIAKTFNRPEYRGLRIVTVLEPDGLPNLVTNTEDHPLCAEAKRTGIQERAVRYALDRFHKMPHVYAYMDFAHSGWLGWEDNLTRTVELYTDVVRGTRGGFASVDGLVTNVSNYTPLAEPFLTDPHAVPFGDLPVRSAAFYGWNLSLDEEDFAANAHAELVKQGWPATTGMLIDTSRNGWGGPDRPTAESTSTELDTYVEESKADRRAQRGLWCNVAGAGLGEPPQGAPAGHGPHVHAFVWVKPPGESDGSGHHIDNDEGKLPDPMCDPEHRPDGQTPTGALPDAPLAGHWFHDQFTELVRNAHPPVPLR